jgi:NAD(P)-dependent dehydrogenase (short-subunit alcohol dehydrogenase family)
MKENNINKWLITGASFAGGYLIARSIIRSARKLDLKDQVVLITGGSRGLGLVIARQLADKGAKVAICARSAEGLDKAADELSYRTSHLLSVPCDITKEEDVKKMVAQVREKFGHIDIVINNAGTIQVGPMETMKEKDYKAAMDVYFWGPFNIVNEVFPIMKAMQHGRIVNIVSVGGKLSFPHLLPYNTSKFALAGFSEGITAELARNNVFVTTVYPGLMRTGSPRNVDVKGQHEKEYAWFKHADSLPLLSMNADKAAKKIIRAMRIGKKTLTLTIPAKVGKVVHEVAPDLTISYFDLINRLLPEAEEEEPTARKGFESESKLSSTIATKTTDTAAKKNKEETNN